MGILFLQEYILYEIYFCILQRGLQVAKQHFRTAELHCATEDGKQLAGFAKGGRSKVNEANVEVLVNDNVLVLDVAVNDLQLMQVRNRRHELST
jgi:hypothetical protein